MESGICAVEECGERSVLSNDPIKYRRQIFVMSLLDFLLGFLMLSIWSFRSSFSLPLMDDTIVDHFGVYAVIWLFLLYSFQIIMAMILCGATQKSSGERSGVKMSRWFKGSVLIVIMLFLNNLLFFSAQEFAFQSLSPYLLNLVQVIFRIFAMAFLVSSNRKLMFGPYALRLHQRILNRNIGQMAVGPGGAPVIIFPPPPYDDFPPTYEEATNQNVYHSKTNSH